jgi:integrase
MKPGPKPFVEKTCPACGVTKPRSEYYKKGETVSHKCKPCSLAAIRERAPKYIGKYSEYQNEWRKQKYSTEPEYREKIAEQKKAWRAARIEELKAKRRFRWANDPYDPARKYYRRKDVKDRTPKWVDLKEVLEFYAKCPEGYEVDHIVPLKGLIDGRPVTGLHALHNLQYLTKAENRKKYNRITEETLLRSELLSDDVADCAIGECHV